MHLISVVVVAVGLSSTVIAVAGVVHGRVGVSQNRRSYELVGLLCVQ